jgi:hypothetical protein
MKYKYIIWGYVLSILLLFLGFRYNDAEKAMIGAGLLHVAIAFHIDKRENK